MKRSIRIERLYPLGDYRNIKICDEISDLPEVFVLNPEVASKAYMLLLAHVDLSFYAYMQMFKEHGSLSVEESMAYLSELIGKTTEELNAIFSSGRLTQTITKEEITND